MVDPSKLAGALAALSVMFVELFGTMAVFERLSKGTKLGSMVNLSVGLVGISTALAIMSLALVNISRIDTGQMVKSLAAMGVMLAELLVFLKFVDLDGLSLSKGLGLITLAIALNVMASAVGRFGKLDIPTITKGLTSMGIVLAQLGVFLNMTGGASRVISTATGMVILGGALLVMSQAVRTFGGMDLEVMGKGLLGVGAALAILTTAVNFMPPGMVAVGLGMVAISTAVVILSKALGNMGNLDWEVLGKGMLGIAGVLTTIVVTMNLLQTGIGGAAALLVVSAALNALVIPLKIFGGMSLEEIGRSFLVMAGSLGILGGAAVLLTPAIPALLGLGAAVALVGAGSALAGAGLLAISAGLSAIAISGVAASATMGIAIGTIVGFIPAIAVALGEGLIQMVVVIGNAAASIVGAFTKILVSLLDAVIATVPKLIEVTSVLLTAFIDTVVKHTPQFIQAGFDILLSFLEGIRDNMPGVVNTAFDIIIAFLDGISKKIPEVIQAGVDIIIEFIDGMAKAIDTNTDRMLTAMNNLARAMLDAAIKVVTNPIKGALSIGKDIIDGIIEGIKNFGPNALTAMSDFGTGLLNSVKSRFKIQSPSVVMRDEVGRYLIQGIAEGITKDMSAEQAATQKAQNIVSAFQREIAKFDLNLETVDLEYKLWESLYGSTATEAEKAGKLLEVGTKRLVTQQERVNIAVGEYNAMVRNTGHDSEDSQKAYNKYLQEQVKFNDMVEDQNIKQKTNVQESRKNFEAYASYLKEYSQGLRDLGFSQEEINQVAKDNTGYDPTRSDLTRHVTTDMKTAVQAIQDGQPAFVKAGQDVMNGIMEGFKMEAARVLEYSEQPVDVSIEKIKGKTPEFTKAGAANIEGMSQGQSSKTQTVRNTTNQVTTAAMNEIRSKLPDFKNLGVSMTMAIIQGMESKIQDAAKAAAKIAKEAYEAAMAAIPNASPPRRPDTGGGGGGGRRSEGIRFDHIKDETLIDTNIKNHTDRVGDGINKGLESIVASANRTLGISSPSKVFMRMGSYMGEGLTIGIEESFKDTNKTTLNSLTNVISTVNDLLLNDMDMNPTIRPVLDLTDVRGSTEELNRIFDSELKLRGTSKVSGTYGSDGQGGVSFVQNNYSPKALSRVEIYRQTRNQVSQMKGVLGN